MRRTRFPAGKLRSGQWVILAMFASSLMAAVFGLWYRHSTTRRTLGFWGPQAALLIARADQAPQVEALWFDPPLAAGEPTDAGALRAAARGTSNATGSRGMLNVRQAFVEDSTFRWDQPLLDKARWTYGLVFSSGQDQAVVLFDPAGEVVGNSATGGQIAMEPEASRELEAFFREQFADRMP